MAEFLYKEWICPTLDLLGKIDAMIATDLASGYPFEASAGESQTDCTWTVHKKTMDTVQTTKVKELILKGIASIGDPVQTKEFYVKMTANFFATATKHSSLTLQYMEDLQGEDWTVKGCPVVWEWADESKVTDRNEQKPIYCYVNVANNRIAMVAMGDPAVNMTDYRKSFCYIGSTEPFKGSTDVEGNVLITAGAVTKEMTSAQLTAAGNYFGEYTSQGNSTLQMVKTKSGIKFQKHYPAFITQAPPVGKAYSDATLGSTGLTLEPQGFQASKWTGKYHMSPVYVVHPYEGYRGKMEGIVAVAKHNILHLDELVVDVEGKPWNKEVYRFFDINTDQNFMNYSPNIMMGVAILKEVRYPVA